MTITDEQIRAVAVRMCELDGRDPYGQISDGIGPFPDSQELMILENWTVYQCEARAALIATQAIRDVMGSDDDG